VSVAPSFSTALRGSVSSTLLDARRREDGDLLLVQFAHAQGIPCGAMAQTRNASQGILADDNAGVREEIITMLQKAYWMEIETVMSYIANSVNPDGVRAQEIIESLQQDITRSSPTRRQFAQRIKELYGVVPGSLDFQAQHELPAAARAADRCRARRQGRDRGRDRRDRALQTRSSRRPRASTP
jgi:hypothetical protein